MNWDRMTPEQKAAWEAQIILDQEAIKNREDNRQILRKLADANLQVLLTSINTLKTVTDKANADIGPADIKIVARETRRVARQTLALTKLLIERLDDANVGVE